MEAFSTQQTDDEEPTLNDAVEKLRELFSKREYYAAQTELATIIAKYPNFDVWEFAQKIRREIARADQLFSSGEGTKKADCCVEILTICSDYPPALEFLRATPPTPCAGIAVAPSAAVGATMVNWRRSKEAGVRYRLVRKDGRKAPVSPEDGKTLIDDAPETSFVDVDVELGKTYAYSIFAKRLNVYSRPTSKVARFGFESIFNFIWSVKERGGVFWLICLLALFVVILGVSAAVFEIAKLSRRNDDLAKEIAALKSRADATAKELSARDLALAVSPQRFDELRQTADSMKSELSLKDALIQDLSNQNETYEKQISDASTKLTAMEKELVDSRQKYGELWKKADATSTKLTVSEEDLADARRKYGELNKKAESTESSLKSSEKDLAAAQSQNQKLNAEIKSLRADVKMLSDKLSSTPDETYRQGGEPLVLKIQGETAVFRYCPSGSFLMGSPSSEKGRYDDETQHRVTLTQDYWLLETPVTQALWRSVMGNNPSFFKGDNLPVENISWNDCSKFIDKLNSSGYAPKGMKFAFPTEAEWERACRAGTSSPYSFGNNITRVKANYGSQVGKTTPVRSYSPNVWNLYDMHGNVSEWCLDWKSDYRDDMATDPTGPRNGLRCVIRGGAWNDRPGDCRSARRRCNSAEFRYLDVGFRLALKSAE